jgi:ATP phosphoribosyltransferase regulatory subunit
MTETYAPLRALLADAGYTFVEPPILHEAGVFVELAGEDLRRRLYLTQSADGRELALRPDYTIPVCVQHIATGTANRKANYAYLGPVFRIRAQEPGEFLQAGVESLGRTDRVAADADILRLAFAVSELLGVKKPTVKVGDSALFAAVLDGLSLNKPWQRRLERTFGDTPRLKQFIARANGGTATGRDRTDRAKLRSQIETRFAETGLGTAGGRSTDEILDRMIEKQALAHGIGARAADVLKRFLGIAGTPERAIAELRTLASDEKIDLEKPLTRFAKRVDAFAAEGVDLARLTFAADFGRRLDYYTGFVFEFHTKASSAGPVIGGGRYDRMMAHIGAGESVPAVGFSVWLDRAGGTP